jgi:hypothetical protein
VLPFIQSDRVTQYRVMTRLSGGDDFIGCQRMLVIERCLSYHPLVLFRLTKLWCVLAHGAAQWT